MPAALHASLALSVYATGNIFFFRFPYALNSALLAVSLVALRFASSAPVDSRALKAPAGKIVCLISLAVIAGALLRTVANESYLPASANVVEEAQTGSVAFRSLADGHLDPYFPVVDLLAETGLVLGGPSMGALRLPFVAYSIVGIAFFFLAAHLFFRSASVAFAVSLLYSTNAYLAASGRIAMETFSPVTTVAIALTACFFANSRRTPAAWGLAGITVGLLWQEYFAFRMVAVALASFMICLAVGSNGPLALARDRLQFSREHLRCNQGRLLAFLLMAMAACGPLLAVNLQPSFQGGMLEGLHRFLPGIIDQASHLSGPALVDLELGKFWQTIRFQFSGTSCDVLSNETGFFGLAGFGLIVAGLAWNLVTGWRRQARYLFLAVPLFAVVLSSVLTPHPQRYRTLCTIPFLLLGAGSPFLDLKGRISKRNWQLVVVLAVGVMVREEVLRLSREGLFNSCVQGGFYDPYLNLAAEIRELQKLEPAVPVYLMDGPRLLLRPKNDYEFLYARHRVTAVAKVTAATPSGAFVAIVYPPAVPMIRQNTRLQILREYPDPNGQGAVFVGFLR